MPRQKSLEKFAGSRRPTLTLLFTDIVSSTSIGQVIGDEEWVKLLSLHFLKGREFAEKYGGFVVKVIGDAFMVAFRNPTDAVDFAIEFSKDTGVDIIGIRTGIYSGQVTIMENDIYGLAVNKAARIQSMPKEEDIYVSEDIRTNYVSVRGTAAGQMIRLAPGEPKNFPAIKVFRIRDNELIQTFREKKLLREKKLRASDHNLNQSIPNSTLPGLSPPDPSKPSLLTETLLKTTNN